MTFSWCCFKYATKYIGIIKAVSELEFCVISCVKRLFFQKIYTICLGILLYNLKVLSSYDAELDYTKNEFLLFWFAYLTVPLLVGLLTSLVMVCGVVNKRSDLMLPSIVYDWTLICIAAISIVVQVILTKKMSNLEYLPLPGEFTHVLQQYFYSSLCLYYSGCFYTLLVYFALL